MKLFNGWANAWEVCGVLVSSTLLDEYRLVTQAYSQPHRHYHNLQHITECFEHVDWAVQELERPEEVRLALWYHDAVYEPRQQDNELRSAQWAERSLNAFGVSADKVERIVNMILATASHRSSEKGDIQRLLDIDLAILGSEPERFCQYEQQIRDEYDWVADSIYQEKRKEVLESFLARDFIYSDLRFRQRFETKARHNIRTTLDRAQALKREP